VAGKSDFLSNEGETQLKRYEDLSKAFLARQRALKSAAAPKTNEDGTAVHSITLKVQPHKSRIKKPSQYMQSPFDGFVTVTAEQEDVYQKILLSGKHQRGSKSNIKK
jgi:hypothetical protein